MDQLAILEKICDRVYDSLEPGTAIYMFAAAIYDTWFWKGTDLEKNLAKRLTGIWEGELEERMIEAYKKIKNDEGRLEQEDYYRNWINSSYMTHNTNNGIRRALECIWERRYGLRLGWPK